jgi:hypothetical protein
MGFDTRICGRTYSVVGIDYKSNTYAIMIYENAHQVRKHKAEWLAARGKFSRLLVMVPTREIGYQVNTNIPYNVGMLVETPQWRGASSWRNGYCASTRKRITNEKMKESIELRNVDLLKALIKWTGENPGKKLDDTLIESLQERNRKSFDQMMQDKQTAISNIERYRGLYGFMQYFIDSDIIDQIAAIGARMSYSPFSDYKEPRNRDNNLDKLGFCPESLKSLMKTVQETFRKLDSLCKKCKINKHTSYDIMWSSLDEKCSICVPITDQKKRVKEANK